MEIDFHLSSAINDRGGDTLPTANTNQPQSCIKINNHPTRHMIAFILQSRRPGTFRRTAWAVLHQSSFDTGPAEATAPANGDSSGNTSIRFKDDYKHQNAGFFWWTMSYTYSCANKFKAWLSDISIRESTFPDNSCRHTQALQQAAPPRKRMLPWLANTPG